MQDILKSTEEQMKKSLEHFEGELGGVQAGRAHPGLVDSLKVNVYGQEMTVKQVGTVSTPDPKSIQIQVWDTTNVAAVEKAIRDAESLGLNPSTDGTMVRMNMPVMTEERRTSLIKLISEKLEESHVSLRNARHDGLKKAKSGKEDGSIPEDEYFRIEKQLDELIRKYQEQAQKLHEEKKHELMTV
ncbi:MAG: ribosome recycling factor [Candidatus Saccharibacteria bacterium]